MARRTAPSSRGDAQHRAARHQRERLGVSGRARHGLRGRDPDAREPDSGPFLSWPSVVRPCRLRQLKCYSGLGAPATAPLIWFNPPSVIAPNRHADGPTVDTALLASAGRAACADAFDERTRSSLVRAPAAAASSQPRRGHAWRGLLDEPPPSRPAPRPGAASFPAFLRWPSISPPSRLQTCQPCLTADRSSEGCRSQHRACRFLARW